MRNPPTPAAAHATRAGFVRPAAPTPPSITVGRRTRRRRLARRGTVWLAWLVLAACAESPTAVPPVTAPTAPPATQAPQVAPPATPDVAPTTPTTAPAVPAGPYVPGQSYFGRNGYVEYIAGNAPVIITAPHGGTLLPAEIPDRTASACGGTAFRAMDTNVRELARAMQQRHHARFGTYPHVVLVHLRRTKLDANRPILEAACGDAEAEIAFQEWHGFIAAAKALVLATTGTGWYMDLHGHTHDIDRLELGYLLTGRQLDLSDAELDASAAFEQTSSIATTSAQAPSSFSTLLRGPKSLGALYVANGYPAVPSPADPSPRGTEYFIGGYNTERHACGAGAALHGGAPGGRICGVQVEAHYVGVRDNAANRERFADVTAVVLEEYLRVHWGLHLGAPPPPPPPTPNTPPAASFQSSCDALTCTFTDGSTDADGSIVAWRWAFGDGTTSTLRHPTRTYAAGGTYTVTLAVTDDSAATRSASGVVTVVAPPPPPPPANVAPTARFTSACAGLTCSFTDQSSDADGTITAWQWAFGDGATSTSRNPTRTFAAGGTFTVTLVVTDDSSATGSASAPVAVVAPPPPPPPPSITLTVRGYKVKSDARVDLTWQGATSALVDVYRNDVRRTTTSNDGAHTDVPGKLRGRFTYRVCEAGTAICSNSASVTF